MTWGGSGEIKSDIWEQEVQMAQLVFFVCLFFRILYEYRRCIPFLYECFCHVKNDLSIVKKLVSNNNRRTSTIYTNSFDVIYLMQAAHTYGVIVLQ